jgi:hypothetical protein
MKLRKSLVSDFSLWGLNDAEGFSEPNDKRIKRMNERISYTSNCNALKRTAGRTNSITALLCSHPDSYQNQPKAVNSGKVPVVMHKANALKNIIILLFGLYIYSISYADTRNDTLFPTEKITGTGLILKPNGRLTFDARDNILPFAAGYIGQTYGLIIFMMDGSATNARTYGTVGFFAGLATWTIVAVSTNVVIVPIIYCSIYIAPLVYLGISSSIHNKRVKNRIDIARDFQSSKDTLLLQDSIINGGDKIDYGSLPGHLIRGIKKSEKQNVLDIYRISFSNKSFFAVHTRHTFGLTYNAAENKSEWKTANQIGHRIQFYDKKGYYLATKWLDEK